MSFPLFYTAIIDHLNLLIKQGFNCLEAANQIHIAIDLESTIWYDLTTEALKIWHQTHDDVFPVDDTKIIDVYLHKCNIQPDFKISDVLAQQCMESCSPKSAYNGKDKRVYCLTHPKNVALITALRVLFKNFYYITLRSKETAEETKQILLGLGITNFNDVLYRDEKKGKGEILQSHLKLQGAKGNGLEGGMLFVLDDDEHQLQEYVKTFGADRVKTFHFKGLF